MAKKTETRPATATINPFGLRMQPELRERLEAAASESGRSLNAEITSRLEQSFAHPKGLVGRELVSDVLSTLVEDGIIQFTDGGKVLLTNLAKRIEREGIPPAVNDNHMHGPGKKRKR